MRNNFLPFFRPLIGEEEIREVVDTLRSDWLTTGPKTKQFEKQFADFVGAKHAIALNSCTAGLHCALAGYGIGPGDEVITTPLTFCATANVIIHVGAIPVLADIDSETGCIDPDAVAAAITPKTKAVIPVHYTGHTVDLDPLLALSRKHNLKLIEDAAHALPAAYNGTTIGALGDATAFSFYATKNLITAEGGMLTTNDDRLAETVRIISLHGISKDAWKRYSAAGAWRYEVTAAGFKYNMTDIQASLGIHQLAKLAGFQQRREAIVQQYFSGLEGLPLELPVCKDYAHHAWHLFIIRLHPDAPLTRDIFIEKMKEHNIGTSVHFNPLNHHPFYRTTFGWNPSDTPRADAFYKGLVSLPLFPKMSDTDTDDVIQAVRALLK